MRITEEKLRDWARRIHRNACAHGFHDTKKSDDHWLCMVMTEVAEAVEADRKGKRANIRQFRENSMLDFEEAYKTFIKGGLEEEFADIVIRLLDFAYEKFGERMIWVDYCPIGVCRKCSFTENAWMFLNNVLNSGYTEITRSIGYVYSWAEQYNIDLDWHIEAKMRYNESRPIRHGKAY